MKTFELKFFAYSIIFFFILLYFFGNIFYSSFYYQILLFSIPLIWPGLAHGSLDILTARRFNIVKGKKSLLIFLFIYLLIPILFFISWVNFPELFFILFLILSGLHFGISDKTINDKKLENFEILIRGLIIIILPLRFHFEQTNFIFNFFLVNDKFLYSFYLFSELIIYFLIVLFSIFLFQCVRKKKYILTFAEIVLLLFCFFYFQPLVSFFIYFCFLHSIRHLIIEKIKLKLSFRELILKTFPITILLTISIGILFFLFSSINSDFDTKISFLVVGLASLTISHILLINFLKKN